MMIRDIISIANKLDLKGLTKEADILDGLLAKTSQMAEVTEESSEEPSELIISGLTTAIEGLSSLEGSKEKEKDLELLYSLLEKYLT
jgi:hypothetical protein